MKTSIYVLIDPIDNKIKYLGKTIQPIMKRYRAHLSDTSISKKSSWIKYLKSQNLKPIIKLIDEVYENWEFWEEYWIINLKILGFELKNLTNGGEGMYGYNITKETREKLSKAFKGRRFSEEWKKRIGEGNSVPIKLFSLNGKLINTFESAVQAARELKIERSHITECCKGKIKSCKEFTFRYFKDSFDKFDIKWNSKTEILQLDKKGNLIKEWSSIIEAANSFNIKAPNISRCLRGLRKTCKGFQWKYKIKI
jgi:hypothetical protein